MKNDEYTNVEEADNHKNFLLYPNPSEGFFTIKTNNDEEINMVSIYNLQGRLVYHRKFNDLTDEVNLNPGLKKGFYLIEIHSGTSKTAGKLIVK